MSGLSASGKTTVANRLAQQLGAIHIRSDAVRKHMAGIPLDELGTQSLYSSEITQKTYERLLKLGMPLSEQGFVVILDAKFDRREFRQRVFEKARASQPFLSILSSASHPSPF